MKKSILLMAVVFQVSGLWAAGEAKIINNTGGSLKINTATIENGYIKNKKEVKSLGTNDAFTVSTLPTTYVLERKGASGTLSVTINKAISYVIGFKYAGSDDSSHHPGEGYLTITQK